MGVGSSEEKTAFLRDTLLADAARQLNAGRLSSRLPLWDDEPIPTNQRNLTDVRTRMGSLLEYELAGAINVLLDEHDLPGLRATYVVAHRYPDLVIREAGTAQTGIRLEVKCIEAVAEEKSANFDTLLKDIQMGRDFVAILVWEWHRAAGTQVRTPRIEFVEVFDAYALARNRDRYWLGSPPSDLGEGRQGFDLCSGVTCKQGVYHEEEGNYGKLMRLSPSPEAESCQAFPAPEICKAHQVFRTRVIRTGLLHVFVQLLSLGSGHVAETTAGPVCAVLECDSTKILLIGDEETPGVAEAKQALSTAGCDVAMVFSSKFTWKAVQQAGARLATGKKPQEAETWLRGYLHQAV